MDKEDVLYHTHDGILPSRKRNEIMPFAATWMDLEMIILSEVSHKKRDKYITYMWHQKYNTGEPMYETNSQTQRTDLWFLRGSGRGKDWGLGSAGAN